MRHGWPILACAIALLPLGRAGADELRLRRAVLTLGGVATFEYEGAVAADGSALLAVRRGDIDDVLKSLTVLGDGRRVAGLTLAGPDETAAAFAGLPFAADALGRPLALMNALRGVTVEVRDGSGRDIGLTGRVMGAERDREPAPGARDGLRRTRVTLLTADGLRQFVLENAAAVRIADTALQARLDAALAAVQGQASGDRREIRLMVEGGASTPVRVAVVTAAPLWKASYRLLLPPPGQASGRLQGWAVLENATASDWQDVGVTLQSGNPVTFRQDLYRIVQVARPDVPVDQQARPEPRLDQPALPAPVAKAMPTPMPAPMPAPMPLAASGRAFAMAAPAQAATVREGIAATSFGLPTPVSLHAGETASLPFLDATLPAEPLGLLAFEQRHPLAAVRLTNNGSGGLPGGAVTTLDGDAFAGDALLPPLPAGERRLLTFAEDLAVTADWRQDATQPATALTVAGGVAHLTRTERTTTTVTLAAAAGATRPLLLEIPRTDDATLTVEGGTLSEPTADSWRVLVKLPAGGHATVTASAARRVGEDVALTDDPAAILRLRDVGGLAPAARADIARIEALRREEVRQTTARERLAARRAELTDEEQRLRDNLAAVPATDPLHARLLRQFDAAETSLQDLAGQTERASQAAAQAHDALSAAIAALAIHG